MTEKTSVFKTGIWIVVSAVAVVSLRILLYAPEPLMRLLM